jgi:hypothetical protein
MTLKISLCEYFERIVNGNSDSSGAGMHNKRPVGQKCCESFRFGPQSPKFCVFGLIFDENTIKMG